MTSPIHNNLSTLMFVNLHDANNPGDLLLHFFFGTRKTSVGILHGRYNKQNNEGEFIFKKENTQLLILSTLITFISFFTLTILFLSAQNTKLYKSYFDESNTSYMVLFMALFVVGLGILEEYFWRNFMIKTLPSGWVAALFVGLHFALLVMMITSTIVEWQYCILLGVLSVIWHMIMVYARKLLKFSSVLVYGIAARFGIYTAFYILFLNIKLG
ncbi:unnamed protein product (macronuclear) [Paramecium tetraurelia]|uniref:CAAX prenyl protease 2/Lysostaphin resistance protein A-like domain-containing protein n=1 Tax=Paramecium tetraurelia TaxID=5888 RepID=A0BKI7_PARTE|nr:uncharacterized protein GSPATT00029685001 [Paramecium tetraurelia]CAK59054.1 unnamed protein product [Paramecium tetraurelia]|eukprot:XP_001426452.1 hypothetical protein (macronuclear) [Paramecium tetraurelia strain d4-2]